MNTPVPPVGRLAMVCLCLCAGGLQAQTTRTLIKAGNWSDSANWSGGVVPANNNAVLIQKNATTGSNFQNIASLTTLTTLTEAGPVGPTTLNAGTALTLNNGGLSATGGNATTPNGLTVAAGIGTGVTPQTTAAASLTFTNSASASYQPDNTPVVLQALGSAGYVNGGGIGIPYSAGTVTFTGSSTAGMAVLNAGAGLSYSGTAGGTNYSYVGSPGRFAFTGYANGGLARAILNGSSDPGGNGGTTYSYGTIDLSGLASGGTTLGSVEGGGAVALGPNSLTVGGLNTSTAFSGVISGKGMLTKTGGGTLTLSGANAYTGGTTVNAGTLRAGAGGNVFGTGAMTVNAGTLDINGQGVTVAGLAGAGGTVLNNGAAATLTTTSGANATYAGTLADGTGVLTLAVKNGGLMLSGTNAFTGGINLTGGALIVSADGNLGTPTNPINFLGGVLQIAGGNLTGFGNHPINASTFNGGLFVEDASSTFNISQPLAGPGALTLYGSGTVAITGPTSFTGQTNISGTLVLAGAGSLAGSVSINLNGSGSVLNVNATPNGTLTLGANQQLVDNGTVFGNVSAAGLVFGNGTFNNNVTITSGGTCGFEGTINGRLTVDGGGSVVIPSTYGLTANGGVVNNGTMRFARGASLVVGSGQTFINNGVLDVITGSFSAPAGFTNNGVVYDAGSVRAKSVALSGGTLTVAIDSLSGHTYQLQRSATPDGRGFADLGPSQNGATGTALAFTDASPGAAAGFYRVVVDASF